MLSLSKNASHMLESQTSHNLAMITFSRQDPLVKWLSDALPVLISAENEIPTEDKKGNPLPTLADVKKENWGELSPQLHALVGLFNDFSMCHLPNEQIFMDCICWVHFLIHLPASLLITITFAAIGCPMTLTKISSLMEKQALFRWKKKVVQMLSFVSL